MTKTQALALSITLLAACPGAEKPDTGTDVDSGTGAELDATGNWSGECATDFTTTTNFSYGIAMSLVDDAGVVTGTLTATQYYDVPYSTVTSASTYPYTVDGTREGDAVVLNLSGTTGGTPYFDLVLAGDQMDGVLVFGPALELACALSR
jgi:hypothetical protein